MDELTTTQGIVALAAAGVAVAALALAIVLAVRLRRLRADQRLVLGERGESDLVAHALELEREFGALRAGVEETAGRLDARMESAERRLDGAIAYRSLVRYDAYDEMSGHQSISIALLDAQRNGIVLTSIHHREQARLYAKRINNGEPELELSPEEADAVRNALAGGDGRAAAA